MPVASQLALQGRPAQLTEPLRHCCCGTPCVLLSPRRILRCWAGRVRLHEQRRCCPGPLLQGSAQQVLYWMGRLRQTAATVAEAEEVPPAPAPEPPPEIAEAARAQLPNCTSHNNADDV